MATLTGVPAGGWFGEGSLLRTEPRRYDAVALRDSRVALLPRATFYYFLDSSIGFNRFLLLQLNERLAQFIAMLEYERLLDPDSRVARCLAWLFNPFLYPGIGQRLQISQEEIGFLSGVSRQRVNQALHVLEENRLLHVEYGALSDELLELIDWQQVYLRVLEHKRLRGWNNIVVSPGVLRQIAASNAEIRAPESFFEPRTPEAMARVQEAVCQLLEGYFDKHYRLEQNRYESQRLEVCQVKEAEAVYDPYRLRVPRDLPELLNEIQDLIEVIIKGREPDWNAVTRLKYVRFDRHLFQPLLVAAGNDKLTISPQPLEKSEKDFVVALKKYWDAEKDGRLAGTTLFLLRNLSRGKGIGFCHTHGFFPDFIL